MTDLASKRIVVTGGSGFLGGHLVERLKKSGCSKVFAPTHKEYDLTQIDAIERLFEVHQPEVLIHGAAVVGGIGANRANPGRFFYENAIMGIQLIESARLHGVEKTVVLGHARSIPRGRSLVRLSRRDERTVRARKKNDACTMPGLSRTVRNECGLSAACKSLRTARQFRSAIVARHSRAYTQMCRSDGGGEE